MLPVATCRTCGAGVPALAVLCPRCGGPMVDAGTHLATALVGQRVGDYEIKRQLGEGATGVVYEALHPAIGKRVAVKVLRDDPSPDALEQLVTEARAVNAVRHRGIVDIFNIGQLEDGRPYIMMELLSGKSLAALLREQGALPVPKALSLLEELLAPLSAAHAAGVIHRDLKPGNIHVVTQNDGTQYVKLLDFGLAKRGVPGESTQLGGTVEYMAPEAAKGVVSSQSDLYSVGVVAFEMLSGRLPFSGKSAIDVMVAHLQSKPPRLSRLEPDVTPDVEAFVLQLLDKAPERRPHGADEARAQVAALRRTLQAASTRIVEGARGRPRPKKELGEGFDETTLPHRRPYADAADDDQPVTEVHGAGLLGPRDERTQKVPALAEEPREKAKG